MDLNMVPEEEEDEGIDLNMMPQEEEEEAQHGEDGGIDLNMMPQEEDEEAMNWMPQEDEEEEDEVMNWILQEGEKGQEGVLDEKWFDMTRLKNSYYVLPREPPPERTVTNINSIGKVMFLTVVARPQYNYDGELTFDEKIGIWAFIEESEVVRTSHNRARGTRVLKPVKVTRPVCREYLISKVIPTIQEKWPDDDEGATIFIQQDNAKPHVLPNYEAFLEAVEETDLDIKLMQQPPNNPDLNCLDLCFHNSLQSLTDCRSPTNIQELIQGVEEEFENYDPRKLYNSFMTLQAVMFEIMKDQGGNQYKLPHLHKERLQNDGREIISVYCDSQLVADTRAILEEMQ
ncbi:hypothetical protein D1007_29426 [Hordeum vulgare]|nr:hypothetical protein D1007_29426 [Hordeum vulgare]